MEKNWDFYYEEANGFYNTANKSFEGSGRQFNNELIFNIVSMSMERFLISLLLFHNKMPLSETVSGLMRELKEFVEWPEEFKLEVRWMNKFLFLCSLDPGPAKVPDGNEMVRVMAIAHELKSIVATCLPEKVMVE